MVAIYMLEHFQPYNKVLAKGVRLPQVHIEKETYDSLGLKSTASNQEVLRRLCWKGVKDRGYDKLPNAQEYYDKIKYELGILNELGFGDYMLLNWEILDHCAKKEIPTNDGRGSAGSSLVAGLLNITKIDPLKHGLFFERFVSKSRARKIVDDDGTVYLDGSLVPDIDNDIDYSRRGEVIQFIEERHQGKTCRILTLNTLSGKMCMKECLKIAENCTEEEANAVSETIPKKFGKVLDLVDAVKESEKFAQYSKQYSRAFQIAQKLEGLIKNTGVHPSGIAICYDFLEETMPYGLTKDGELVSGFEMNDVSSVAIKFDILGLRTLTVLSEVSKMAGVTLDSIDLEDAETFKFLQNLVAPQGLFQIETDTGFRVCQKVRPKNIYDLSAVLAIARPGAISYADQYAKYSNTGEYQSVHPFFDDVLKFTGGIPLYQEELISMARKIGFTADEGEQLRRSSAKKKPEEIAKWKEKIEQKVQENNLDPKIGEVLWKVAEDSAGYSFNFSHSVCYSVCSFKTAFYKTHYPKEFFLALLKMAQHEPDPLQEVAKISQELPLFNIRLLPPDLIKSSEDFTIEGNNIRFGLSAIKGISEQTAQALNVFRGKTLTNKFEVFNEAKDAGLNIGALCSLIQAGCLDSFNTDRSLLMLEAQVFNTLTAKEKITLTEFGQSFNYDVLALLKAVGEGKLLTDKGKPIISDSRLATLRTKYKDFRQLYDHNHQHKKFCEWFFEKKLLGYSYTHTLRQVFHDSEKFTPIIELLSLDDKERVRLVGTVDDFAKSKSKKNDKPYLRINLSDEGGKTTVLFFDKQKLHKDQKPSFADHPMTMFFKSADLEKEDIVVVDGQKSGDILFANEIKKIDTKIFSKVSEAKK